MDLKSIKKFVYYLKPFSLSKTEKFIEELDDDNLVFKFLNDDSFDKASDYLNKIHKINNSKVEIIISKIGDDNLVEMCRNLEIKIIIQGLSKLSKINPNYAVKIFDKILILRDIVEELKSINQFQNLCQKLLEFVSIHEKYKIATQGFIKDVGINYFVNLIVPIKAKEIEMGFLALKEVDNNFCSSLAKNICTVNDRYYSILLHPKLRGLIE